MDAKMDIQDFIATVKNHKDIWDKSSRHHHNRFALEKTWLSVARETRMTVKDAQTKWKSLRDYYRKEIRRLADVCGTDDIEEESTSESTWPYFKHLNFLRDQFNAKKPYTSSLSDPLSVPKKPESPLGFVTAVKIENLDDDSMERSESGSVYFLTGDQSDRVPSNGSFTQPCAPGKRRKVSQNEYTDAAQSVISKSNDGFDEDRHFFESLLPHSKRIQGVDKMLFRGEVQKLIIKYAYSDKHANCSAKASHSDCEAAD